MCRCARSAHLMPSAGKIPREMGRLGTLLDLVLKGNELEGETILGAGARPAARARRAGLAYDDDRVELIQNAAVGGMHHGGIPAPIVLCIDGVWTVLDRRERRTRRSPRCRESLVGASVGLINALLLMRGTFLDSPWDMSSSHSTLSVPGQVPSPRNWAICGPWSVWI